MIIFLENVNEFKEYISKGNVLVDFYADWCGPCKMMEPHLENLAANYKDINIIKVNVDKFNELASYYQISSIPTLLYFTNGKLNKTNIGYITYSQLERIIK